VTGALATVSFAGELAPVAPDTLEGAYLHLGAVDQARAAFAARLADEHRRLEDRRAYVLGSLSAARRFLDDDAPEGGEGLVAVEDETRGQLEAAAREVEAWAEAEGAALDAAWDAAVSAVEDRCAAYLSHHVPEVRVTVHRLAGGRRIVHLARPTRDDAVLLCALLAGRPPLRHAFLEDDAVDAVDGPVHLAVRTGDVDPEAVTNRGAEAEDALAGASAPRLLPIRAHLPVHLPKVEWPHLRLMARGPVLELEARAEGAPYEHVVSEADAELFTGYLVSLRVRGRLAVEVEIE
jgi:hypothetical protein